MTPAKIDMEKLCPELTDIVAQVRHINPKIWKYYIEVSINASPEGVNAIHATMLAKQAKIEELEQKNGGLKDSLISEDNAYKAGKEDGYKAGYEDGRNEERTP